MKPFSCHTRIQRAEKLLQTYPFSREPLTFYREILLFQKKLRASLAEEVADDGTGRRHEDPFAPDVLGQNLSLLAPFFPSFFLLVKRTGTEVLAAAANRLGSPSGQGRWVALLNAYWAGTPDLEEVQEQPALLFFPKAFLQPLAETLAEGHTARPGKGPKWSVGQGEATCPLCARPPQLAILRPEGEGARRSLLCSLCATEWRYKRVSCPACGEEEFSKLAHHEAKEFPHVRVDVCESCRHYFKSIDLTVDGHAVPVVDEVATLPLDLWAVERGYSKIELNLVGM